MSLARLGDRAAAQDHYKKALSIQSELVKDFPGHPDFRQALGWSHYNLGTLLYDEGNAAAAQAQFELDVTILFELVAEFPQVIQYRTLQARALARSGRVQSAMQLAGSVIAEHEQILEGPDYYDLACVYAICVAEASASINEPGDSKSLDDLVHDEGITSGEGVRPSKTDLNDMEQQIARILKLLNQAHDLGSFNQPTSINALEQDPELDSIRDRLEFKSLIKQFREEADRPGVIE